MFAEDVKYLCCPLTLEPLTVSQVTKEDSDGEIIEGRLTSVSSGKTYAIKNGIPRFVANGKNNDSWHYKWTQIDQGKGLNYRIVNKSDPAYEIHDLFDRNSHGGKAYQYTKGRVVLDLGCGVGQYSWRMIEECKPAKLVSLDLTGGVDLFRKIMLERFPQNKSKILIVQADVFSMPFCDETFDYVFSFGVLMHTGNTREAIRQASRVLKDGGELNIWIYASEAVPYEARESGRRGIRAPFRYSAVLVRYTIIRCWIMMFRLLPHAVVVSIIRAFSSDLWYTISRLPVFGYLARSVFSTVMHPDRDYRYINNYDGYCNSWSDTWSEYEIFPVLRNESIVIKGISEWRLGIWGIKQKGFYD